MKKWLIVFIIYFVLVLIDGGLTLYNTPDLSWEGNPLVTHFHLGWGALITVNAIVVAAFFIGSRFTFEKYKTVVADVTNFREYVSMLFYNRPDKFVWSFYKLPKNWKPFWACLAYVLCYSLIIGRAITDFEWIAETLNWETSAYDRFRGHLLFGRLDIAVGLIAAVVLLFVWLIKEYKKGSKQNSL